MKKAQITRDYTSLGIYVMLCQGQMTRFWSNQDVASVVSGNGTNISIGINALGLRWAIIKSALLNLAYSIHLSSRLGNQLNRWSWLDFSGDSRPHFG